ncbi:methyltransferase-like protein 27 [Sphaeramia orbicularis]|uniref:methyltransferase-like protein 27 n=1 Tax=Sphaeramia orbicularis TaxID=375764 RepID=UPI00117E627B|nr:methyltransferase-like protein 27 [Sphaeramia orbicularis]
MSTSNRTVHKARIAFQSSNTVDSKERVDYYDIWAHNYEEDHNLMSFRAPHLAVDFLSEHFCGRPEETQVLDVACGTGWVTKLMTELGFRSFVGVDGSKGMLELAAKTGLYQDLKLALLGTQPLPAQTGVFDVMIIVGVWWEPNTSTDTWKTHIWSVMEMERTIRRNSTSVGLFTCTGSPSVQTLTEL